MGQDILDQKDVSSLLLRRPVDRGFTVNWDLQKEVWGHGFKALLKEHEAIKGKIGGIVVSEPYLNLPSMRQEMQRMLREDMKFSSVLALYPATMAMYYLTAGPESGARRSLGTNRALAMEAGAGIIIDIGFSYTHIVPFFDFHPIKGAIKRIDPGRQGADELHEGARVVPIDEHDEGDELEGAHPGRAVLLCLTTWSGTWRRASGRATPPFGSNGGLPDGRDGG